jgi:hypothetical protein
VWFEDFGGRDDDAEVAYLDEVATSTIYLGVLGRIYGALDRSTRLSATHAEYREAERLGLSVTVWASDVDEMDADQYRFLQEVRTFHTTGSFTDAEDLSAKLHRRLQEMCAEAVSPWIKLGEVMIRAHTVVDNGSAIVVRASVHTSAATAALEEMRPDEEGMTWSDEVSYTGDEPVASPVSQEWNHALSEIVMAVLDAGLSLELLQEHDSGLMVEDEAGEHRLADRPQRLPASFTLLARKP